MSCFWITWTSVFRFKDISVFSTAVKSSKQRNVGNFVGSVISVGIGVIDFLALVLLLLLFRNSFVFWTSVDNVWKKSNTGRDRDIRSGKAINV